MNVGNKHSHGRHYLLIIKLSFRNIIEIGFIFNSKIYLYTSKIFECYKLKTGDQKSLVKNPKTIGIRVKLIFKKPK